MTYPRKTNKPRLSKRELFAQNQKAMDSYALIMGKPTVSLGAIPDAPKPRAKKPQEKVVILEKEVQKAIMDMLKVHPKVVFRARFNRGVMQSSYNGKDSFTQFNSQKGFSDIHGMLRGGKSFYLEVKRPSGGVVSPDQKQFLDMIVAGGGIAGVVRSVDDALELLK